MMEWEKPYVEKCIEVLEPSGSVLEIRFWFWLFSNENLLPLLDVVGR